MVVLKQTQTAPLKIRWLIGVVPLVIGTSVPVVIDDLLDKCAILACLTRGGLPVGLGSDSK